MHAHGLPENIMIIGLPKGNLHAYSNFNCTENTSPCYEVFKLLLQRLPICPFRLSNASAMRKRFTYMICERLGPQTLYFRCVSKYTQFDDDDESLFFIAP